MRNLFIWIVCLFMFVSASRTWAQTAAIQGDSYLGGTPAKVQGVNSSNYLNGIIPSATITVYLTGTQTLATIYKDGNNTPLSNPFTSNAVGSVNPGGWIFFAAQNQGYDIVASGGIAPNTYPTPVTLCTDCYPSTQFIIDSGFPFTLGSTSIPAGSTTTAVNGLSINGVTLNNGGASTNYLDETGNYSTPAGIGTCAGCVQLNPSGTQTVTQPAVGGVPTTLQANVFQNQFYANLFGTGSNGIETVYDNSANCIPLGNGISDGCSIEVPPLYTNSDAPQGWKFGGADFGGETSATNLPPGGAAYDYRNGTAAWLFHDPINAITGANSGLIIRNDWDLNFQQRYVLSGNGNVAATGLQIEQNEYAGGHDFLYYPSNLFTTFVAQDYRYGLNLTQENWTDGIDFGELEVMRHHGMGDALLHYEQLFCDGGLLAGSSEGCEGGDTLVTEDPTIFAGNISALTSTTITINCNQACTTEGQDRLWVDYGSASAIAGSFATGIVDPQTTGSSGNSAIMPPQIVDTAQNFPVSTMFQLCNANADNGEGGAAGCTAGNQPIGIIPPLPLTVSITSGSVSGGVATFVTASQGLVAGQTVMVYNFTGVGAPLNNTTGTVLSAGLSSTGFEINTSVGDITSTGAGRSTQSPTGFSPPQSIVLNVVAPYTGSGGDTNGTPAGFCTSSTLQSSNPGDPCYLPASGVLELTDGIEYESDNYTYNSGTQQVTIANMMFPHLNGVVGAYGGLAGWALQDNANLVNSSSGLGVTGTIAPTYSVAGSISATALYYVPQRTNEQYGVAIMGLSNPSNGNQGYGRQLYFSVNISSLSIAGGVVTFSMTNPPEVSGDLHQYSGLVPTITTSSNTTYSCSTCAITWLHGNVFTYTPAAPSGTTPTSGTITYNNAGYAVYPSARVMSAFDTTKNQVDGTLTVYPYDDVNDPLTVGDAGREAHYQQMQISGRHVTVKQFQPNQYTGRSDNSLDYVGNLISSGFSVTNDNSPSMYLGEGGNWPIPGNGYFLGGTWLTSFSIGTAPDQNVFTVGAKGAWGVSSKYSNFNIFQMPSLASQDPVAGSNGQDCFAYDPNYGSATRSQGTMGGMFYFDSCPTIAARGNGGQPDFTPVTMGYLFTTYAVTTPTLTASNIGTTQLGPPALFANPIGTTGATTYHYFAVGNAINGGQTLTTETTITSGNATLSATNYNLICVPPTPGFTTYDILKGSTATSIITGLSAVGNGGSVSPVQPNNYSCFEDQGGATSSYDYTGVNTTGGGSFKGPLSSAISVTAPTLATTGSTPSIASGTASNSDVNGQLTLVGGTASYSFQNSWTVAPICTASDTTAIEPVQTVVTATTLTVNGTGTDVINYICSGRD